MIKRLKNNCISKIIPFLFVFSFNIFTEKNSIISSLGSKKSGYKDLTTNLISGVRVFRPQVKTEVEKVSDYDLKDIISKALYPKDDRSNNNTPVSIPSENSAFRSINSTPVGQEKRDSLSFLVPVNVDQIRQRELEEQDDALFFDAEENEFLFDLKKMLSLPKIQNASEAIEFLKDNQNINILSPNFYPVTNFLIENPSSFISIFNFIKDNPRLYKNNIENFKKYRRILSIIEDSYSSGSLVFKRHISDYGFPFNTKGIKLILDSSSLKNNDPLTFYINTSDPSWKKATANFYVFRYNIKGVRFISDMDQLPFDKDFATTYVVYDSKFNSKSKVFFDIYLVKEKFYNAKELIKKFDAFCYYHFGLFPKKD